jgi:enamine deaminase RidA (YjgF/YER057c/UK114 family)
MARRLQFSTSAAWTLSTLIPAQTEGVRAMIQRLQSSARMSQAVVHGDTVYLAGQVAGNTNEGVAGQTRQVLAEIERLLAAAGSDKTRILTATIYLADITTFAEMNLVWDTWVAREHPPARATVEARLAAPAYKVEIQVVAAKN